MCHLMIDSICKHSSRIVKIQELHDLGTGAKIGPSFLHPVGLQLNHVLLVCSRFVRHKLQPDVCLHVARYASIEIRIEMQNRGHLAAGCMVLGLILALVPYIVTCV